ncbi:MAG: hypothetical protein ACRDJW_00085 [Thermomicrobiales bacterium]
MDERQARRRIDVNPTAAAPAAYSYWFVFTYFPPALLAGREARMR